MIIRSATPADMDDIARLCWAYRDLLIERMADVPDMVETYYAKADYGALITDLPRIHARPRGDILLAEADGIIGCAMYYPISARETEIKRIFVSPEGRGQGAAKALVMDAMARARADGYDRMVLDTVATLTEAIALYRKIGFAPCAPFYTPDPQFVKLLRFYDITL
ncbi:MAG: GNAT family N-acetyltransferase [Pseudomonadota bacterium]